MARGAPVPPVVAANEGMAIGGVLAPGNKKPDQLG
jgi:hypothetical protein